MDSVKKQDLFENVAFPSQTYDEMFSADGSERANWGALKRELNRLGSVELNRRVQQADEQIANHGVTFNPYDLSEGASRPWSFDAIPVLFDAQTWHDISVGLVQRARLLDLILRDLWGPQHLIRDQIVPPFFLFAHPGFHPAYAGLVKNTQQHLHFYAADLARGASGKFWVMGDRTRAPFGLGYTLENRLIAANLLLDAFKACRVQRLAGFFESLHRTLSRMAPTDVANPHIVILTKGPGSRSFFEDAYMARHLGYTLVHADDLAVRNNQLVMKTLGGLQPVHVVWRRINDEHSDPVELESSGSGVAGLLEVIRSGNVVVVNSLGSRLVESPLLSVWLPQISAYFSLGELKIPSVPTWWCGDRESLDDLSTRWHQVMIRPAFRMDNEPPIYPAKLTTDEWRAVQSQIEANPTAYVAQQVIERSTAPVWYSDQVQRWPLALRGFVLAAEEGYQTLPGGLARVSVDPTLLDQSPTSGEKSQDVWIQGHQSLPPMSLHSSTVGPIELKRSGTELPSRVADSFFWLGRNIERAEAGARLMRCALWLLQNEREGILEGSRVLRALAESGQIEPDLIVPGIRETLPVLTQSLPTSLFSDHLPLGFRSSLDYVIRLSGALRDRLSEDAWRIIHRLDTLCDRRLSSDIPDVADTTELLDKLISITAAFSGLVAENTTRTLGWRFLDLGRRIERAQHTATFLEVMFGTEAKQAGLVIESALQVLDSLMTYRLRYLATLHPTAACDLLMHDQSNPRSLAYQLDMIELHISHLPCDPGQVEIRVDQRLAVAMKHSVRMSSPEQLMRVVDNERPALQAILSRLNGQLSELAHTVSSRYLVHAPLQRHFAQADPSKIARRSTAKDGDSE